MTWMFYGLHTRLCLDKQDLIQWMNERKKDKNAIKCHQKINIHYKSNNVYFADVPTADHGARC